MTMFSHFFNTMQARITLRRSSIFFLLATILLHFLFFQSTQLSTWATSPETKQIKNTQNIAVSMRNTPLPTPKAIQKNIPENTQQQAVKLPSPSKASIAKKIHSITQEMDAQLASQLSTPAVSIEDIFTPPIEAPTTTNTQEPPSEEVQEFTLRILESADMELDLERTTVNGSSSNGVGKIMWRVNLIDNTYTLSIQAGLNMLVTTLNLYKITSEGELGGFGLFPLKMTESRLSKAETATHFNRETNQVSFSASTKKVPMEIGIQDKASVMMQLAAIGYSNAEQMKTGQEFIVQVAEERGVAMFSFIVAGEELIDSQLDPQAEKILAVHLVRPPKLGSYNSKLEIWLAPSLGWYPIQIRNTESNGTTTTQKVRKLQQIIQ